MCGLLTQEPALAAAADLHVVPFYSSSLPVDITPGKHCVKGGLAE